MVTLPRFVSIRKHPWTFHEPNHFGSIYFLWEWVMILRVWGRGSARTIPLAQDSWLIGFISNLRFNLALFVEWSRKGLQVIFRQQCKRQQTDRLLWCNVNRLSSSGVRTVCLRLVIVDVFASVWCPLKTIKYTGCSNSWQGGSWSIESSRSFTECC